MTPLAEQAVEIRNQESFQCTSSTATLSALRRRSLGADESSLLHPQAPHVALLTGGGDKPYALGMATALTSGGMTVDVIGGDDLNVLELLNNPQVNFLNLRGDQRSDASLATKILRVLMYYWRLVCYAAMAKPTVFHILWNNKVELFDRTLLMLYYKFLGKNLLLTAHNVNTRKRDSNDTWLNRFSLRAQYRLSDHIVVHTEKMKSELVSDFCISESKVSVIPFGINNTVPNTSLSSAGAKQILGVGKTDKTLLFFGNIAPYKGLEHLISAFTELLKNDRCYRLIIVGKPKGTEYYWNQIREAIADGGIDDRIIQRIEYVPDEETELYFKAADVLIIPYTRIFQSGVLFLGYAFGLPAIAADVGSLRDDIVEGKTGFLFRSRDPADLARKIRTYFASDLYGNLETCRKEIRELANERNSWTKVTEILDGVYRRVLAK
jgi:glycosyltransferase involved in cell wall biosynthesis